MTLEEAKQLYIGQTIIDFNNKKWKITSIKTWKRNPNRIEIGLKYGLYRFAKIDENQLHLIKGVLIWSA